MVNQTPNGQHFNEPSKEETSSEGTCRLRDGLNADCLLRVFHYLSVFDLIAVCKLDAYFKDLIMKWIIEKKVLNLGEIDFKMLQPGEVEMFEMFGKSMRKFIVGVHDFNIFLKTIIGHCEPANFTKVELIAYDCGDSIDPNLLHRSMPFFSQLRELRFSGTQTDVCAQFLEKISETASHIEIFRIRAVDMHGGWLKNMRNLRELDIHPSHTANIPLDDLRSCLMASPELKMFKFRGGQPITAVGDIFAEYCPGLNTFSDVYLRNAYEQFDGAVINHYDFLSKFSHLNSVTLTSYTFCGCDLYYPLKTLETKKIVTLKIHMKGNTVSKPIMLNAGQKASIMRHSVPQFLHLQTLQIEIGWSGHFCNPEWTNVELRCQYMFRFMTQLKHIQNFQLVGIGLNNVHKIIEIMPNIRTLHLYTATFRDSLKELQNIVRTLRSCRQLKTYRHIIHIILDEEHWKKLRMFKYLKAIMTTEIGLWYQAQRLSPNSPI